MIILDNIEIEDDFSLDKVETDLNDKAKQIMEVLSKKIFVIDDIINEGIAKGAELKKPGYYKEVYVNFYNTMIFQLLYGYEHKEFREYPVHFKFHNDESEQLKTLEFRYFVANLAFWYPVITVHPEELRDEMVITRADGKLISTGFIAGYMNKFYTKPYIRQIDHYEMSETFADVNFLLTKIPLKFSDFFGLSISIEEIRDMANRMPDFKEGLYVQLDPTKQPAEQEAQKKEYDKAQIARIVNDEELTTLRAITAPRAVKNAQLAEFISIIGNKPSEDGKTIPTPINNNYVTGNLGTIMKYYINNISGRKAAITNHEFMGSTGYLLILVALLCVDVKLSRTVSDCRTSNLLPIEVKSKDHLIKLNGRRYKRNNLSPFKTIDSSTDEDLIGTIIWLRSPVTCAAPDGICKECYGDLYYVNTDLHSVGCYAAFTLMNPLVQGLLSAKHFQGTSSKMIDFGDDFYKYFLITSTDIILNPELEDMSLYSLVIAEEDIVSSDYGEDLSEMNEDSLFGGKSKKKKKRKDDDEDDEFISDDEMEYRLNYYTKKLYIVKNINSKKNQYEITEFHDPNTEELYMHDDLLMRMSKGTKDIGLGNYLYLNLEDITLEEYVFMINVDSNGTTVPMNKMKALINNSGHSGATTYEEMAQMMLDLTIESGFSATSVHGEIIIRQLIRNVVAQQTRPNFERVIMPQDYVILTILTALKKNPSFSVSFSSAYLAYQLIQYNQTFEKNEVSDFDWLYKRTLNINEDELYYRVDVR